MGYFRFFFTYSRLFTALYPTLCVKKKKKNLQKILQITIYEKSKNFTVIVSQIRVQEQKNYRGGGAPQRPPPTFIGLKMQNTYNTPFFLYSPCKMLFLVPYRCP